MLSEEFKTKLIGFGMTEEQIKALEDEGVNNESQLAKFTADQIKQYSKCGFATALDIFDALKPVIEKEPVKIITSDKQMSLDVLPQVPDDVSFIEALKTGGILKVGSTEVISAMKAAIAASLGLYSLPEIIQQKMEAYAEEQENPVGSEYFELQKLVTSRSYGDVLSVMGISGNFMSESRKKAFLIKLNTNLWTVIKDFYDHLINWKESWSTGAGDPSAILAMFVMGRSGQNIMPPDMLQPPDTSGLRDEAEAVINKINKIFAGVGIPVARALAYDATRIRNLLEQPTLPAAVGTTNKDQMLKTLGVSVGADYVRLEYNITRFVLSIMELPKIGAGDEELLFISAMFKLGLGIPWNKISAISVQPQSNSDRKKVTGDDKINHY